MTNKLEDSFFYIPDTARDPAAPPRYFVATPDDEDGNYSINAFRDTRRKAGSRFLPSLAATMASIRR